MTLGHEVDKCSTYTNVHTCGWLWASFTSTSRGLCGPPWPPAKCPPLDSACVHLPDYTDRLNLPSSLPLASLLSTGCLLSPGSVTVVCTHECVYDLPFQGPPMTQHYCQSGSSLSCFCGPRRQSQNDHGQKSGHSQGLAAQVYPWTHDYTLHVIRELN